MRTGEGQFDLPELNRLTFIAVVVRQPSAAAELAPTPYRSLQPLGRPGGEHVRQLVEHPRAIVLQEFMPERVACDVVKRKFPAKPLPPRGFPIGAFAKHVNVEGEVPSFRDNVVTEPASAFHLPHTSDVRHKQRHVLDEDAATCDNTDEQQEARVLEHVIIHPKHHFDAQNKEEGPSPAQAKKEVEL